MRVMSHYDTGIIATILGEIMEQTLSLTTSLRSIFLSHENSFLRQTALVLFGVLVLTISAQLSVPLKPVPLTFQSTAVVLIGMAYGARYGAMVVATYLLAGLMGLPIFAGFGAGPAKFFGPTLGYLLGFFPAAILSGYLAQKGCAKHFITSFLAAFLGISIIFLCGTSVLAQSIGWYNAVFFGVLPFIVSEPIKLIVVALCIPKLWKNAE